MTAPADPVTVLGPGAVGLLLAALLYRAGTPVTLLAREASVAALAADGVAVASPAFGAFHARPRVETRQEGDGGALLVAVKAPQLEAALERVTGTPDVVVPLLNGIDHLRALRARFGERVVAASVRVQAHRDAPGHVVHRAPFLVISIAEPGAPALAAALRGAGAEVHEGAREPDVLWGKLSRLAALALATAATARPLGDVRGPAEAAAREVAAVAVAEGAAIDAETVVGELRGLPDDASSSLAADVAAGAPDHELDAIAGAVLRAAARHGLPTPVVAELRAQVAARG